MLFLCLPFNLFAQTQVIDGDDIIINNQKFRLFGIDAPEFNQFCEDKNQKSYPCGMRAKNYLNKIVTASTYCKKKEIDKYNRIIAICYNQEEDINAKMVKQGWAVAYTRYADDYLPEQNFAKKNKLGIWQGKFVKPERFRIENKKKNKWNQKN